MSATVGTTDLRRPHKTYLIKSAYVHEKYNRSNSWINDIALLEVSSRSSDHSRASVTRIVRGSRSIDLGPSIKRSVHGGIFVSDSK